MLTSRISRQKYDFPLDVFNPDGHVIFSSLDSARAFSERMLKIQSAAVSVSELYALSLLDEACHRLINHFQAGHPDVMPLVMAKLQARLASEFNPTLIRFTGEFPPLSVFLQKTTAEQYLAGAALSAQSPLSDLRETAVEEMLLINLANQNPAAVRYKDLFDDEVMSGSAYREGLSILFLAFSQETAGSDGRSGRGETLADILFAPIKASPDSLEGQLRYIIEKWGHILGETFTLRAMRGVDYLKEDILRTRGPVDFSRPEIPLPYFGGEDYPEHERYSTDKDWMPRLVLLAKNTYVWLDQLSRQYQRSITTLDQIPDEELDLLAKRGFTGLWLIGLWERSAASQRIKQRMGLADAVASAYSLHAYEIAQDLGGWGSLHNLRSRAWSRGIRLSADMVPNHMGIDSTWVIEHPDWFLSSSFPPYSSYSFQSENVSDDPRVRIILEDHYYDRTDAAVSFQRRDSSTGDVRYLYHGNDGTSFPWNDTAQLDYTNPTVREAVIQVILQVARNFPVIRFDAAMTLAKKHIQRLWFPEPGAGGAIPSRSQYGMSRAEFESKIPEEFWREVVNRVAVEVPDTLLLAEAFWLMEGYFVRTLGMHRVYNSAFMHMLRDEDNAKYRTAIRNTLEFDPQILKRYVNFMNNPDEKTAVEQFGRGDKYFGICTVLSTLPGLPMFGHGQVEGLAEKYGMEFRRPKWEETSDEGLVRGHEWRIFPLLHRRYLFADVEQFLLYDFYLPTGVVDENVFAYTNRYHEERGLVIYHNKYSDTRGWINVSAAYIDKITGKTRRKNLAEGLSLPRSGYVIFRDYVSQKEYIRPCQEIWEKGLYAALGAYQCHVFMDFRFVDEPEWQKICGQLNGLGTDSLAGEWEKITSKIEESTAVVSPIEKKRQVRSQSIKTSTTTKKKTKTKAKIIKGKTKTEAGKPASKTSNKKTQEEKTPLKPKVPPAKKKPAVKTKKTEPDKPKRSVRKIDSKTSPAEKRKTKSQSL